MGSNYNINIAVTSAARSGGGGAGGGKPTSAREYMQQARESSGIRDEHDLKGKATSTGGVGVNLAKLDKNITLLTKEIRNLNATMQRTLRAGGFGGGGGRGGGSPLGGGAGGGGGLGHVGGAASGFTVGGALIGTAIAALGYGWSKMSQAADAGRAARVRQIGTEGISGTTTGVGMYSGSDMGQLRKTRAMSSGQFESARGGIGETTGREWIGTSYANAGRVRNGAGQPVAPPPPTIGDMNAEQSRNAIANMPNPGNPLSMALEGYRGLRDTVQAGSISGGQARIRRRLTAPPSRVRAQGVVTATDEGFIGRYGHKFGIGAEELGKQLGSYDVMAGGRAGGNAAFAQTAKTVARGGGGVETARIMGAIGETLEDAVTRGVNSSTMAEDMAKQVTLYKTYTVGGRADLGLSHLKQTQGSAINASKGKFGGMSELAMMNTATEMITGEGADKDKARADLVAKGRLTAENAKALASGKGIGGAESQYAIQSMLETPGKDLMDRHTNKLLTMSGAMHGKKSNVQRAAEFSRFAQGYLGEDYSPAKAEMVFKSGMVGMAPERIADLSKQEADIKKQMEARSVLESRRKKGAKGFGIVGGGGGESTVELAKKLEDIQGQRRQWEEIGKSGNVSTAEGDRREAETFRAEGTAGLGVRRRENRTESLLLTNEGISRAIAATDNVNNAMLGLAGTLADTVAPAMEAVSTAMVDGIGYVGEAVRDLRSLMGGGGSQGGVR